MVELFSRAPSSRSRRKSSNNTGGQRLSFLSLGSGRRNAANISDVERFFADASLQPKKDKHQLLPDRSVEGDAVSHNSRESTSLSRREIRREIVASRSQRRLMRQVSALGLEDPANGDFGRGSRYSSTLPNKHPSHFFEDMDLMDLPPDMREDESIASDPTAVVEVDKSLLEGLEIATMKHPNVNDGPLSTSPRKEQHRAKTTSLTTSITTQSPPHQRRPSIHSAANLSHCKVSVSGSTAPSTAPSRASFYGVGSFRKRDNNCSASARKSGGRAQLALLAEAAQAMMNSSGISSTDPIYKEAMEQSKSSCCDVKLASDGLYLEGQIPPRCSVERSPSVGGNNGGFGDAASSSKRSFNFCAYVPPSCHQGSIGIANKVNIKQSGHEGSQTRALPDFCHIFPLQRTQPPQHQLGQNEQQPLSPSNSIQSSTSKRSTGNISCLNLPESISGDSNSAVLSVTSKSTAANRSMASPWRQPAPWNDEVAPSIFFKSKAVSATLGLPHVEIEDNDEDEDGDEEFSVQKSKAIETTVVKEHAEVIVVGDNDPEDEEDLNSDELEELKNELAELEAALSFQ